ncbi:TetR/AcrR family transcriptional regulator [Ferrimonas sediminicola]|uniref:TetR/AcrR family transcriptional regulator n=1 Tax=Ferrimonas sediminicola TaxID=2569538 RepID=A0A4U1BKD7_9GAMM|nr:TetR/AcrR family transcriptional regulator [Ferrimonas sediminicola]TKB50560.1 TetR/AcrR family transcriptional regulator [Ferrimonas sediminicola]
MARQCSFDREEVLERAMELFWTRGYEATSVANLVEHLGINRFSLYNSFGDKKRLYHLCLRHYLASHSRPKLLPLLGEGAGLKEIEAFLHQMAQDARPGLGCFVQSALLERRQLDEQVAKLSDEVFDGLHQALKQALERARSRGELRQTADPDTLAHWLVLQIQGIRVLLRAGQAERVIPALTQIVTLLHQQ